jgi:hypothetical protein
MPPRQPPPVETAGPLPSQEEDRSQTYVFERSEARVDEILFEHKWLNGLPRRDHLQIQSCTIVGALLGA